MEPSIIVEEEFLITLLEDYPRWATSAEGFLGLVTILDIYGTLKGHAGSKLGILPKTGVLSAYGLDIAEILHRELNIHISPYENVRQLALNGDAGDAVKKIIEIWDLGKSDKELEDMLFEMGVLPSEVTMWETSARDYLAKVVVDRLRPYIQFI